LVDVQLGTAIVEIRVEDAERLNAAGDFLTVGYVWPTATSETKRSPNFAYV
jgi:hypothetical protein